MEIYFVKDKSYKISSKFSSNYNHKAAPLTSAGPPGRATGVTTPIRTATAARGGDGLDHRSAHPWQMGLQIVGRKSLLGANPSKD